MKYLYAYQAFVPVKSPATTNLLTGRVGLTVPVVAQDGPITQTVSLRGLLSGQYVYRLLIAGQPVGAPQKLVLLP